MVTVFAASMGYVDCDPLLSVIATDPTVCADLIQVHMELEDEDYCDQMCDGGEVCRVPNGAPLWATNPHQIDLDLVLGGLPEHEQVMVLDALEDDGYSVV